MSYSAINSAVESILNGVTGIANVHNRPRWKKEIPQNKSLFISAGILHAWFISSPSMTATAQTDGQVTRAHEFLLHGYYEFNDINSSYVTFRSLVDSVLNEFDKKANLDLNNSAEQYIPAELTGFSIVTDFFGYMACEAIIRIIATEEVSP